MKLALACVLALLFVGAHAWTTAFTDPPVNASTAVTGSVWIVDSPACATAVVNRGCNLKCLSGDCPTTQRWTYVAAAEPGNANATRCTFTFTKPGGEATGAFGLSATTVCA